MEVSVVIPTYFRRKDLSELFDSLLAQTYKPLEVVVVDDTPSDEIEQLCKEYEAKFNKQGTRLVYVRNPGERSAAVARNIGVERASGEVVLFLDSDVVFEDYIEKIVGVFKEKPHALGVQGYIVNMAGRTGFLRDLFNRVFHVYYKYPRDSCRLFEYPSSLSRVVECEWLSSANSAYRREVFKYLKFDESLKGYSFMEDVLLSQHFSKSTLVHFS